MGRGNVETDAPTAQAIGEAVARRRTDLGYPSARSLGRAIGMDYRTITGIEAGRRTALDRNTLVRLEVGLELPAGTLTRMADSEQILVEETVNGRYAVIVQNQQELEQVRAFLAGYRSRP